MRKDWEIKKLGEVCETGAGGTPLKAHKDYYENGNIPWLLSGEVSQGEIYNSRNFITMKGLKNSSAKLFPINTVLVAMYGATAGQVGILKFEASTNPAVCGILPNDKFIPKYIYYFFLSKKKELIEQAVGGAQPNISQIKIKNTKIPVLSIFKQQEIVSILDDTFESIDRAKSNAEKNLKNVKELFESYLTNIFRNNNDGWVTTTIGEVCNLQTGGTPSTSKKEYYEGGDIKWLVSGDINQKEIYDCEGRITQVGMNNSNTKFLPVNSVLIALNGQGKTRGTVAMLRTKATCNQSLVSIFPKNERELLPELVFSNLEGRYEEIRKMTGDSGNDRRGLNMPLIRGIKFSYPKSISIQKEVIYKLDLLRKETSKLESIYKKKLNDLEELKKSILQKAFNGELKTSKISA